MDKYYLPSALDAPFQFCLLTVDELFLLLFPIILISFVYGAMVLGFVVGFGLLTLIKKFKGEQGHYYLVHLAYWYLPQMIKFKVTPPSYIRDYLG